MEGSEQLEVNVRIWIHYFIEDTEGNNKWLGQVHHPYRDCTCSFHELSNPNPSCVYTTMNEMKDVKLDMQDSEAVGLLRYKQLSRYPIRNVLTGKYMPLMDMHHGPYCMTSPELLHASQGGLIKYMFQSMQ